MVGEPTETRNCLFWKAPQFEFLSNILNKKSVQSKIPPYFTYKESKCISYNYTYSVAPIIVYYKASL